MQHFLETVNKIQNDLHAIIHKTNVPMKISKEEREKLQSKILSEGARGYDTINRNRKGSTSSEPPVLMPYLK